MFHEGNKLINIQDKVKAPTFHLLVFPNESDENVNNVPSIFNEYGNVIQIEPIPRTQAKKNLYGVLGVKNGGYYLVRPDMYIAYRSNGFSKEHAKNFLVRNIDLKDRH
jgi:hypothetical protein